MYKTKKGYFRTLFNGKPKYVHRLVWEQNIGEIPEGYVVHHKDGDKSNNNLENLQLMKIKDHDALRRRKLEWSTIFCPTLKSLVEKNGYKKAFVAKQTMIPKQTISDYINRIYRPNEENRRKLERLFERRIKF